MKKNIKQTIFAFLLLAGTTIALSSVSVTATAQNKDSKSEWRQVFNGKDLTGWKHVGPGAMLIEDGMIRGKGGMGLLYWEGEKFGNCVIRVEWKMRDTNSNSGIFIRIPIVPLEEW